MSIGKHRSFCGPPSTPNWSCLSLGSHTAGLTLNRNPEPPSSFCVVADGRPVKSICTVAIGVVPGQCYGSRFGGLQPENVTVGFISVLVYRRCTYTFGRPRVCKLPFGNSRSGCCLTCGLRQLSWRGADGAPPPRLQNSEDIAPLHRLRELFLFWWWGCSL